MALRTARERIAQVVVFEAVGLLAIMPLYAVLFDRGARESAFNLLALTAVVLVWSPLHNGVFDRVEWRLARRTACQRPARWRIIHALSHEVSVLVVTVPLLLGPCGHTLPEVVAINLGLTVFYTGWTAFFHLCWDRIRPVAGPASISPALPRPAATPQAPLPAPSAP